MWFHFSSNSDSHHGPSLMLKIVQLQAPYSLSPPSAWVPVGKMAPGDPQWPAGDASCRWECVGEPQTDLASGKTLWRRWVLIWELKVKSKDRSPLLGQAVWFLFCLVCISSFSSIAFFLPTCFYFLALEPRVSRMFWRRYSLLGGGAQWGLSLLFGFGSSLGAGWVQDRAEGKPGQLQTPHLTQIQALVSSHFVLGVLRCGELRVAKMLVIYWPFRLCVFDLIGMKNTCLLNYSEGNIDLMGFPHGSDGKESACRRPGFDHWVRKVPWRRKWQPTPVFLSENPTDRGASWATVCGVRVGYNWVTHIFDLIETFLKFC